ncbi:hypothetical protein IRJ41_023156, partial [Triplophysa rosa]
AQFGPRLAILSLCLLAAVIITEQRHLENNTPDLDIQLCRRYMKGKPVDLPRVITLAAQVFGWDMQCLHISVKISVIMAQFGQRLVIVSLCLLAAVIITEQRFPDNFFLDADTNDGVCIKYMGRYTVLDLQGVFNMVSQEYGLDMQRLTTVKQVIKISSPECCTSETMAKSGQLVAVLGLCFLVAVANCQGDGTPPPPPPPPPLGNEICLHYTQGGIAGLDMPRIFDMLMIEFGRQIQTLNPMQTEQWVREVDEDHDRHLTLAECSKLVQNVLNSLRSP